MSLHAEPRIRGSGFPALSRFCVTVGFKENPVSEPRIRGSGFPALSRFCATVWGLKNLQCPSLESDARASPFLCGYWELWDYKSIINNLLCDSYKFKAAPQTIQAPHASQQAAH